jgi:fucose permease
MDSKLAAVTAVTISGAVVFGLVLALLGSIKLNLARRLDLGERQVAGLLSSFNLALIPMMLASGVLIDVLGARWVLFAGSIITTVGLFAMSRSPGYVRALLAVLLIGLGAAAVNTATVVLMPEAFFENHWVAALSLGHVFIALGALVTPALTDVLFRTIDYKRTIGLLAVLCLAPAVLTLPFGGYVNEVSPPGNVRSLLPEHSLLDLWLAGLVFFFYAPLEGAVSVWSTTYLRDLGSEEERKRNAGTEAWVLTGFWGLFLASRLLVAWLSSHNYKWAENWGWYGVLITVPAVLSAVVLGNLAGTASRSHGRFGLLLVGFLLGPIFPTLLTMLFREYAGQPRGTLYGVLFSLGSVGSLMLAPLFGARATRVRARDQSVQAAFRMPMWIALILAAVALVYALHAGVQ